MDPTSRRLVPLDSEKISSLFSQELLQGVDVTLDLTRELRNKSYPFIHLLLQNPLNELISTVPPDPIAAEQEALASLSHTPTHSNRQASASVDGDVDDDTHRSRENSGEDDDDTNGRGYLYLYDGRTPNYRDDGIQWQMQKMSVKLIVYNKEDGSYKLKNSKADEGAAVMRRQTWLDVPIVADDTSTMTSSGGNSSSGGGGGESNLMHNSSGPSSTTHNAKPAGPSAFHPPARRSGLPPGWRKNEYKLITRETYFKPEPDGSLSVNECQTLQDFPVLVHYFRKPNGHVRKKRKVMGSYGMHQNAAVQPSTTSTTTTNTTQIPANPMSPSTAVPSPLPPLDLNAPYPSSPDPSGQSAAASDLSISPASMTPTMLKLDPAAPSSSRPSTTSGSTRTATATRRLAHPPPVATVSTVAANAGRIPPSFRLQQEIISPPYGRPVSSVPMFSEDNGGAAAAANSVTAALATLTSRYASAASSANAGIPVAVPQAAYFHDRSQLAEIVSYAPDAGPCCEQTKVLLVVQGLVGAPEPGAGGAVNYSCMFDDVEVPAREVTPGVLEVLAPPRAAPGVVMFWCVARRRAAKSVQYSHGVPFYYLPAGEQPSVNTRLTLDFTALNAATDAERARILHKFRHTVRELDLSGNNLTDVGFLSGLYAVETLILDNNRLSSTVSFPFLPRVHTLTVNGNLISDLQQFLERVEQAFPLLQYLSMLNNEACPFFKSPHLYFNYRVFTVSRIPTLRHLDSTAVTDDERRHAAALRLKQTPGFSTDT